MIAFLNGNFVAEPEAKVSILDRSFLYGDGLFEAIRVYGGKGFRSAAHWERLRRGAEFLKIEIPFGADDLCRAIAGLIEKNGLEEAILRLTLSRGIGPRGYSPKGAQRPVWAMSAHPVSAPPALAEWKLVISSIRVPPGDPLASHKSCNKLQNVLARAEAESREADEALLLTTDGEVAEAAAGNLFWIERGAVRTVPVEKGLLPGVTRSFVLELCAEIGLEAGEAAVTPEELYQSEGVFLTLSSLGIVEAITLENHSLARSPLLKRLCAAYEAGVRRELSLPPVYQLF